jgi:glycosyltransferase involved in cell wall biosynthesis
MQRYYTPEICGTLIPLGIKRPIIQPVSRDNYGFSEHDILFITVGRLVGRKAIDQLINILAGIDNRTVHLLVLGSGPKENELKKLSSDLQLNDNIHFYGFTDEDEKYRLLGISDVFVSTSQHEGFGIVFLEAMACGLPVICYDHGGQTDFLENQKTGYLVKLNETEEFANACKSVIESDDERLNYKQENLDRIESLYIENCASQYENVFQDVIDKHRSGNIE